MNDSGTVTFPFFCDENFHAHLTAEYTYENRWLRLRHITVATGRFQDRALAVINDRHGERITDAAWHHLEQHGSDAEIYADCN